MFATIPYTQRIIKPKDFTSFYFLKRRSACNGIRRFRNTYYPLYLSMRHKLIQMSILALMVGYTGLHAQESAPFRAPFPSSLSVAHTWNRSLTKKAGQMVGEQLAREGVKEVALPDLTVVTTATTGNILNTYGQSPYLTAETGVEMVKGLQNKNQLKAYLTFDAKEKNAPYVRPWQRVNDEAHAAGIASPAQVKATAAFGTTGNNVSDEFKTTALQVAHESITLLKNTGNILPLDTTWAKRITVCGDAQLVDDMLPVLKAGLPGKVDEGSPAAADLILVFEDDNIDQARMEKLLLTGKPVALVLLNSRPVALGKANEATAIIEAWHPGQQGMQAITNVLAGTYNPGGKLAVAFPDYAFGHGLSYTDFRFTNLRIEPASIGTDGSVTVRFNVTNTGTRAGAEVVQVYLVDEQSSVPLQSPKLEACKRTNINPGQTKEIKFTIRHRNMVLLNRAGEWTVEPGFFTVRVGNSSDDIRLQGRFEVK